MARSISLSTDFYNKVSEIAKAEHRTVPMQIVHWSKKAQALQLSIDNPWLDVYNAELLLEASESKDVIEIEDIDAYFKTGGKKGFRSLV